MVRVRNSLKLTILLIGLVLVLEFPIGISAQEYEPPHDRPGPAAGAYNDLTIASDAV